MAKKAKKAAKKSAARGKRPAKKVQRKGSARKAAPRKAAPRKAAKPAAKKASAKPAAKKASAKPAAKKASGPSSTHGWICWHELQTNEPNAAFDFYKNIFGWSAKQGMAGPDIPYLEFTPQGASDPVGGVTKMQAPPGTPPNWLPYVAVDDIDTTAREARDLGGQVYMGPMDIPNVGRFAVLADPTGATIAAITMSRDSQPPEGMPPPGATSWTELMTTDMDRAADFYAKLFGWEPHEMSFGDKPYVVMKRQGKDTAGIMAKPPDVPVSFWVTYFHAPDLNGALQKAQSGGAKVYLPPMEIPNMGTMSWLGDPQGAMFALFKSAHA